MDRVSKIKQSVDKILCTAVTVILLLVVIFTMISHTYKFSEDEAFEKLHLETQQIKKNINLQMLSDRENLVTMANFAAELQTHGESYELLFDSFEEIGLFENIGILLPDNKFITKFGTADVSGKISFEEEAAKGEYISGRVKDITNDKKEVIRSAVPIKTKEGTTVAILYGVIELSTLEEKYAPDAAAIGANLYVIEAGTGKYIIDTRHDTLGNVTALTSTPYKKGFSYSEMITNLSEGKSGYSAYKPQSGNEYVYAHYAPLEFSDWQIMLSQPESDVFASARATSNYLALMATIIVFIMIVYIAFILYTERRKLIINATASNIRKHLLEVNQEIDKIHDALKIITNFTKARSAFVMDTYEEYYKYVAPTAKSNIFTNEDREYFISQILNFASKQRTKSGASISIHEIKPKTDKNIPEFCDFLQRKDVEKIYLAIITSATSNTNIMGVINPKSRQTAELLKEIAACSSIALNNKKYLARTETMALTDALTGAQNRLAYKQDIKLLDIKQQDNFACIYIDVNELHYFNGQYGHAAGDQMLVFIAETLRNEFEDCHLYRMGGDEFLIFSQGFPPNIVEEKIHHANEKIEEMKYHISIGVKYADATSDVEELVNEAEKIMYFDKSKYYQSKEVAKISKLANRKMEVDFTGIKEIDACITVMSTRCLGVYCVCHEADTAVQVLTPSYFSEMLEESHQFSTAMRKYIHDIVKPEYHRILFGLLEYNVIENQLKNGENIKAAYTKIDGENVSLTIYSNKGSQTDDIDTIWIFEKTEK